MSAEKRGGPSPLAIRPSRRPADATRPPSAGHSRRYNVSVCFRLQKCRLAPPPGRRGVTLVEALVATSLAAIAGSALLLGLETSLRTGDRVAEKAMAEGLARQLIDEIVGRRYMAAGGNPQQWPLSASSWENQGAGRERYNDTDDYHNFRAQPAEGIWGHPLGQGDYQGGLRHAALQLPATLFANWRQEIDVFYVSEADPSTRLPAGATSSVRAIEVRIYRVRNDGGRVLLAKSRRVIAWVGS